MKRKQFPKSHYTVVMSPYQGEVTCTDPEKDITVTLTHIPIEALDFFDDWVERLIAWNGGHGEITLKIKDGQFVSAGATETVRFRTKKQQEENSTLQNVKAEPN